MVLIWYILWLMIVGFVGVGVTILNSTCDADDSLKKTDFGVKGEYTSKEANEASAIGASPRPRVSCFAHPA